VPFNAFAMIKVWGGNMYKKFYTNSMEPKALEWIKDNYDELYDDYLVYVDELQDSSQHKRLLLSKDECFWQWAEEIYYDKNNDKID
jgi:hypothetical protein